MQLLRSAPVRFLALIALLWLIVFFLTRAVLMAGHLQDLGAGQLAVFAIGLLYDLSFLVYALLPLGVALLLMPARVWRAASWRWLLSLVLFASVYLMLFTAVAEWLFWDEFGVRFNFIAVDYLVYSDEVLNNILESYPVGTLLGALALISLAVTFGMSRVVRGIATSPVPNLGRSLAGCAGLLALALAALFLVDQDRPRSEGGNTYARELSSNGPYQFFAAFRNNELDYPQFYATLPAEEVARRMRAELAEPNARFIGSDHLDIRRRIENPGTPKKHNIVLVTIESLSAKYLGSNGDGRNLTPNMDELRRNSLYFNNFYATGTRTDRGLEAITLSIPPTPGRSIVKRIGRESGFASLGQQLQAVGYDAVFVYGGRGYFDNMNAFFGGNGYRIVDQSSVNEADIHFKNAWGMSDEDLYAQAIRLADENFARNKPFLLQLMTTSNHRPYTYPEGRIDIPSGNGRDGAVKYTDYAIGKFLQDVKGKPWFDNTIFVFVADHTAGSAGKEDLPVANYQIPLFIYAPKLLPAGERGELASQIDLAPTLLSMLNLSYESTFFGRSLMTPSSLEPRVVIGNYQHLGLFDGKDLAILSPRAVLRRHNQALGASEEVAASLSDPLVDRAVSYYQSASYGFTRHLLDWKPTATQ
ncbi:LTA synthase family protein [Pseudomonas sp. ZM23]|uniref:LTA synthase family protein n=1 Tax=Pseudomonas triclosanedens TaxID=2961893 RepID=A0ABY6ZQQ3_9PSED|nr:LTA synthase family protein [Pseudomonas triclosanedens]MCP8467651.1 LTA synthase family protein [Pseudomonas triclosanedens]MCP8473397.1 LTA synthase family protein [Pseudomonas triclosanedens]MCP8479426.1 LTA synthase family protein [Pseudomonas triclosanedens]WAI47121.1 LTA synthase family protein [Pseudomonas triclosanedens]